MSKKETRSHSTIAKTKTVTKGPLVLEEYFCLKEMQPRPVTMSYLEKVADMLVEFADLDDSLSMVAFYRLTKIPKSCMQRWVGLCPKLDAAFKYAMATIGDRRECGAVTRKYDTGAVWRTLYQFSDEYKQAMEFAAKLAKKEDLTDAGGVKFIIMPPMQSDPSMEKHFKKVDDGKKE
jgi:cytochrome c551/c552